MTKIRVLTYTGSFACLIHCIVTPMILLMTPILRPHLHNHWLEVAVLLGSIACGSAIIYQGFCAHKQIHSLILFGLGVIFWVLHSLMESAEIMGAIWYLLIGTTLVLTSYWINHRKLNCCKGHTH